jgi:predicted TIM-barrel fold metal-dependent hydrolase
VVFDHFAQAEAVRGVDQPGFASLLRLLESGRAYVKVSGGVPYFDAADRLNRRSCPSHRRLIAANTRARALGSDWPHPDSARRPGRSTADLCATAAGRRRSGAESARRLGGRPAIRHTILVENPARLYGF